ncbi:MAG: hypothetical protein NTZ05_09120 [Chloroflexi bacterium]|nr:hypothetical protein [Chloroflexota bacterium]
MNLQMDTENRTLAMVLSVTEARCLSGALEAAIKAGVFHDDTATADLTWTALATALWFGAHAIDAENDVEHTVAHLRAHDRNTAADHIPAPLLRSVDDLLAALANQGTFATERLNRLQAGMAQQFSAELLNAVEEDTA